MNTALLPLVRRLSHNPTRCWLRLRNPAGMVVVSKLLADPTAASQPGT